jgi:hypothetical protein
MVEVLSLGKEAKGDSFMRWKDPSISWRGGNVEIPPHTHAMLVSYIERGQDPLDDFMYAILSNDLKTAVHTADEINLPMIHHIVAWLYNYAPADCQGSEKKVSNWINRKGMNYE